MHSYHNKKPLVLCHCRAQANKWHEEKETSTENDYNNCYADVWHLEYDCQQVTFVQQKVYAQPNDHQAN